MQILWIVGLVLVLIGNILLSVIKFITDMKNKPFK